MAKNCYQSLDTKLLLRSLVEVTSKREVFHFFEWFLTELESFPLFRQLVFKQETVILSVRLVVTLTIIECSTNGTNRSHLTEVHLRILNSKLRKK